MAKAIKIVAAAVVGSLGLAACGGGGGGGGQSAAGGGAKSVVVGTDLPLQGANKDASTDTNNMVKLYLKQIGGKVGDTTVTIKQYDDSTAAKGGWDDATCAKNAQDHVLNKDEVAVVGTYNSGCAKLEVPVLNQDPDGPMLMVSHANTNPGLTKKWDPGEPDKYYPTGQRNYARVVTTDDYQGAAIADFAANQLGLKKCFVVNDNQTYGQGVAKAFVDSAPKVGIQVLGNEPWDAKQPNYVSLFQSIKAKNPDCIIMSGIYDQNGGQLVKDKVSVVGSMNDVKTIAPDGFVGFPDLLAQKEAQGMYTTFAGLTLPQIRKAGGAAAKLLESYKQEYGKDPSTGYALYAVAALQVILQGIEKSDGTRKGITQAVLGGQGVSISAQDSAIGKAFKIDPATGDIDVRDITVQQVRNGQDNFVKAVPIK